LSPPLIKGTRNFVERDWKDASILVGYVDRVLNKIFKYGFYNYQGLQFPTLETKDELEQKMMERQLIEKFVREFRKPPVRKIVEAE